MKHSSVLFIGDPNLGDQGLSLLSRFFERVTPIVWKKGDKEGRAKCRREIRSGRWDLTMSFYSDLILQAPDLERSPVAFNIHPGLPELPGMGYEAYPLVFDHPTHGVTLHFIEDEAIDAGAVIDVEEDQLPSDADFGHIRSRNQELSLALLERWAQCCVEEPDVDSAQRTFSEKARSLNRPWGAYVTTAEYEQTLRDLHRKNPEHRVFGRNPNFMNGNAARLLRANDH